MDYYEIKAREMAQSLQEYVEEIRLQTLYGGEGADLLYTTEMSCEVALEMFHFLGFSVMHIIRSKGLQPANNGDSIQTLLQNTSPELWTNLSASLQQMIKDVDTSHAFIQAHGYSIDMPTPWKVGALTLFWSRLFRAVSSEILKGEKLHYVCQSMRICIRQDSCR